MKTKNTNIGGQKTIKRLCGWAVIVAAILMIPLLAKWPWAVGDFIFGAGMLFGSATIYELITRNMSNKNHRIIAGIVVGSALALVWIELAVGIFD